jgi:hypothetical protein
MPGFSRAFVSAGPKSMDGQRLSPALSARNVLGVTYTAANSASTPAAMRSSV